MSVNKYIKSLIKFTTEKLPESCNYIESVPSNEQIDPTLCRGIECDKCLMNYFAESKDSVIKILENSNVT
jgi:hypothetical protein